MYTNDEWLVEHVWDMTQLTTNNYDYQKRLKEIQKEGEVLHMIKRNEHLALSSGEQEEEMVRLREENIMLHQQLEESQQEVRRSNRRLQETQVQLRETQVQLRETQVQTQVRTYVVMDIIIFKQQY